METSLSALLTRRSLSQMAGGRSFERGQAYFSNEQVVKLAEHRGRITAKVWGTREYRVKLWIADDKLDYECTCPVGDDGAFCKHCVAVGLVWLEQQGKAGKTSAGSKRPAVTMDDVQSYLSGLDKKPLVDMLMKQAMDDERLRERLLMRTASRGPRGIDIDTFYNAIDNAVQTGGFVEYAAVYDYAHGIEDVIGSVEELLKDGHAAEVIDLIEHALKAVEATIELVDDSNGNVGGILERLQQVHHSACRKAKPDPINLARRLFEWELRSEWSVFYGAAKTYADVLGKKGLAAYRELAEAEWARVPPLKPGQDDPERYGKRFRITSMMERLAEQSGDIEALVVIKSRDLSSAYAYLQIAETYKQARKYDRALDWAERGVKAFPDRTDDRLREFLADEYHRRKRHKEALALIWTEFSERPGLDRYKTLKDHATRARQWPTERKKALALIRKETAESRRRRPQNPWSTFGPQDHSELVRIFLWEKDTDAAWREAKKGGCANNLWMELARMRERTHPEDALPIYREQVEPVLAHTNNDAYRQAVSLLKTIRRLMVRLGRKKEFTTYLDAIRSGYKRKRNFMKMLERVKW